MSLSCLFCSKVFENFKFLEYHMWEHTLETPTPNAKMPAGNGAIGDLKAKASKLVKHASLHKCLVYQDGVKQFRCGSCQNNFTTQRSAMRHHRTSHGVPLVPCKFCELKFNSLWKLGRHEREEHSEFVGATFYRCKYCPKKYTESRSLSRHVKTSHAGLRNRSVNATKSKVARPRPKLNAKPSHQNPCNQYTCLFCNKSFSQMQRLETHMSVHTQERAFQYTKCAASYTTVGALNNHLKTVHMRIQKPCKIPRIKRKYKMKSKKSLKAAVKRVPTHAQKVSTGKGKPFRCTHCENVYTQAYNARRHYLYSHVPVDCQFCYRSFSSQMSYKQHQRKEHPKTMETFRCNVCSNEYTNPKNLWRHQKATNHRNPKKTSFPRNRDQVQRQSYKTLQALKCDTGNNSGTGKIQTQAVNYYQQSPVAAYCPTSPFPYVTWMETLQQGMKLQNQLDHKECGSFFLHLGRYKPY